MNKLAIIDLDGVVFDSSERFKRATRSDGSINWDIAFDPRLCVLDTIIPGAREALAQLNRAKWNIVFLSSRPEAMTVATLARLVDEEIVDFRIASDQLILKPKKAQYTKTIYWKNDIVERLLDGHDQIIFVDDEETHREFVDETATALGYDMRCYGSLDEV